MFAGFAAILWIHFYTPLLWTWYVPTGAGITFLVGAITSLAGSEGVAPQEAK
jgi:hypothetical protein